LGARHNLLGLEKVRRALKGRLASIDGHITSDTPEDWGL